MRIERITFNSFEEFINSTILPTGNLFQKLQGFVFRGESTKRYKLIPSALRKESQNKLWMGLEIPINNQSEWEFYQVYAEYTQLRRFFKLCNNNGIRIPKIDLISKNYVDESSMEHILRKYDYKWISDELAELAALAQHYGIPTRLLDWTFDLNVAIYFACIGAIKKQIDYISEDDDMMVIWDLNSQHIQFLEPTTSRIPLKFVVPAYANNPNLCAQKGILSYWEIEMKNILSFMNEIKRDSSCNLIKRTPIDELLQNYCEDKDDGIVLLYKFKIPVKECLCAYKYLHNLGYGASKLFPGYNGVVREMEEEGIVHKFIKENRIETK